ncbi:MAG: type IX secretion system membrane protein PorP/SprF [Cytophagales bacterium]|nr:type IX secretion system membrane protein PorP/SprF [Cytophagales bacterium]
MALYFLSFMGLATPSFAQTGDNSPIVYDQYFKNLYLVNPSSSDFSGKQQVAASVGNRTLTGLFEGVNRIYADFDFSAKAGSGNKRKVSRNFHRLGLQWLNNRDGEYFQRNRIYGRYSWQMALSKNSSISVGVAVGVVNYAVASSSASGGGAATSPDANLGIWYMRKYAQLGVSFQQIFNNSLSPINQPIPLAQYFNFNGNLRTDLGRNSYLSTFAMVRYQNEMPFYGELASFLTIYKHFETGVNYRHGRGLAMLLGVQSVNIGIGELRFMASYLISTRNFSNVSDNVLEFSLGYTLLRK